MKAFWSELTFEVNNTDTYTIRLKKIIDEQVLEIGNDQTNTSVVVPLEVLLQMVAAVDELNESPELTLKGEETE